MIRRSQSFRIIAASFAVLFGVAPVAASIHADEHAHVYCAEHQVIEESASEPAPRAFDFAQGERILTSSQDHQSCAFLALAVRNAVASETTHGDEPRVSCSLDSKASLASGHDVVAVLFEAPKASPPLA